LRARFGRRGGRSPFSFAKGDEELRPVGVGSRVRHRERPWAGVLQPKVFVIKGVTVDGLATSAVVVGEIPSLGHLYPQQEMPFRNEPKNGEKGSAGAHKLLDHPVEGAALVAKPLFMLAQGQKVLYHQFICVG